MHHIRYIADNAQVLGNQGQLLLNVLIGVALPALVALVTHRLAGSWVKSLVLLILSVLGSLLATVTVANFHWLDFATAFVIQFGAAVVSHYGVQKPFGITGSNGVIQKALPGGVGGLTSDVSATTGTARSGP